MKKIILNSLWVIFVSITTFLPLLGIAQKPNYAYQNPPEGKARIFFIYTFIEEAVVNNLYIRVPFFINDTLVCRMTNNHYSIHDVDPGIYKLSVQRSGKKIGKNAFNETETLEAGDIVFYRYYNEISFLKDQSFFKQIKLSDGERLLQVVNKEKQCVQTINFNPPVSKNKKFYIQLQIGASNYTSDYTNWKSRFGDPLVTNFNPFTFGGEFSKRMGTDNHYLGFELYLNKQPAVEITPPFPNGEQRFIRVNQIGFLYRYFIKIDKKNKITLAPKIGLGIVNLEERTNDPSISDNTLEANSGLSFSLGLYPEYRFSKNMSIIMSSDYINGSINAAKRDNLKLNSFRLLIGIKYQFDN
jgi:hypothetical protein